MKKHRIIFRDIGANIIGMGCLVAIYLPLLVACASDGSTLTRAIITSPLTNTSVAVGEKVPIVGQVTGQNIVRVDVVVDATVHASLMSGDQSKGSESFPVQTDWVPAYTGAHFVQLNVYGPQNKPIGKSDAVVFIVKEVLGLPTTMALTAPPIATVATASPLPLAATSAPATAMAAPLTPTIRPSPTAKAPMAKDTPAATVAPITPILTITTRIVNVRSGPGIQYDVLGYLELDAAVPVRGRNTDGTWWQIVYVQGVDGVGWIRSDLGQVNDDTNVPVVVAPALPVGVPTGMPDTIDLTPTTATPSAGIRPRPSAISNPPAYAWQIVAWRWPPENTAARPKSGHTIHSCHFA